MNDGGFQRCLAALAVPVVALVVRHVIVAAAVEYLPDCTTFFFWNNGLSSWPAGVVRLDARSLYDFSSHVNR